MKKIIFLLVLAAAGGYWLLLSKPGLYFDKAAEYRVYSLHARGAVPENREAVLDKAYEKISSSELFNADRKFNIYLTGSRNEFLFFTPFQEGEHYRVSPLNGNIFIAPADFAADKMAGAPGAALSAALTGAAARELARSVVDKLKYVLMSDWKLRGYSERVTGGTGSYVPADICKGADPARLDYEYGLAVDYALRVDGISITELLNKDYSYEVVAEGLKKNTCGR